MRTTRIERIAAVAVGLESLGIMVLVGWQIVAAVSGDTDSSVSAIALIVMTALVAALVAAFAVAVWRGVSWGRSGSIVAQILLLAVALGAATGTYGDPSTALVIAIPAVAVLSLLIAAVRAASRRVDGDARRPT